MRCDVAPLARIQERFWQLVTRAGPVVDAAVELGIDPQEIERAFPRSATMSARGRLDVYSEAYFFRVLETLAEQHAGLRRILGDDAFRALVRDYLRASPPTSFDLGQAGDALPDYLRLRRDDDRCEWLADLARVERLEVSLFTAPDAVAVPLARLAGAAPDELARIYLAAIPASALVSSRFAIDELHRAVLAERAPELPPPRRDTRIVMWRPEIDVLVRVADEDEAELLRWLETGATVAELGEALARRFPVERAAARLFELLGRWTGDGLVVERAPAT